jgi:hypothetical protein
MGLFTKDKKVEYSPGYLQGQEYLTNLLQQTPSLPQQQVAGLTPVQQLIMSMLPGMLQGSGEAQQTVSNYYRGLISDKYDVFEDPRYEALRQESERLTRAGQTSLRRGAERSGQLDSTPAKAGEAQFLAQSGSELLKNLGALLTNREQQRLTAASGLQSATSQGIQNAAAVGGIADWQRVIEQQQNDAMYQWALMTAMFPYQYQTGLAQSLMNAPGAVQVTGGGLTGFGEFMSFAAPIAGAVLGGPIGAGLASKIFPTKTDSNKTTASIQQGGMSGLSGAGYYPW